MVCASPRSGSTLLCDLLALTSIAGDPQSYFRPATATDLASEWGVEVSDGPWDRAYVDAVRERGEAGTGCFGMRIMWSDMAEFIARLHHLYPSGNSDVDVLGSALGVRTFVHLSRDDKVAQAVSLVLAEQTGLWHLHADGTDRERHAPRKAPTYDRAEIEAAVHLLEIESLGWSTWFDHAEIAPLTITYEELISNPTRVLERVFKHLGGEVPQPTTIRTSKLATSMNDEWTARFRAEKGTT